MFPITVRRARPIWDDPSDLLPREFGRLFGRLWDSGDQSATGVYPVDIREDKDNVYVDAELPGFTRDRVDVTLENGVLSIAAEREHEKTDDAKLLTERRFTRVARSFTLPTEVDDSKIDAKLADGVLHLTMPKRDEARPRRVEVK